DAVDAGAGSGGDDALAVRGADLEACFGDRRIVAEAVEIEGQRLALGGADELEFLTLRGKARRHRAGSGWRRGLGMIAMRDNRPGPAKRHGAGDDDPQHRHLPAMEAMYCQLTPEHATGPR